MKRMTGLVFFMGIAMQASLAIGNPLRTNYVCVPPINPSASPLEFRIREGGACAPGETLMLVQNQKDGSVLIYPAPPPSPPEETEALENYKRYHGITP